MYGPVAFSPDRQRLAAVNKIWDLTTGKEVLDLQGYPNSFTSHTGNIVFSPSGKLLASGTSRIDRPGAEVTLWDCATGRIVSSLSGHTEPIKSVAFSPDGKLLASASFDTTVK